MAGRDCTPSTMALALGPGDPQAMTSRQTTRARPPGSPPRTRVRSRAGRYVLAATVIGMGIVGIELSPGVGWVLILVGAWFAADTSQRPSNPGQSPHTDQPGSRGQTAHRLPPARQIDSNGRRPTATRPRRPRGRPVTRA
jgi:hypothetical protein